MVSINMNILSKVIFHQSVNPELVYKIFGIVFFLTNILLLKLVKKSELDEEKPILKSIQALNYRYFLVVSITITGFLISELITDRLFSRAKNIFSKKSSIINLCTLSLLCISTSIIWCVVIPHHDYIVLLSIYQIRVIIISITTCCYLSYYGGQAWKSSGMIFMLFLISIGFHLQSVAQYSNSDYMNGNHPIYYISTLCLICAFILFILSFLRWGLTIKKKSQLNHLPMTRNEWNCFIHGCLYICSLCFLMGVARGFILVEFSANTLILIELGFTSFTVFQAMHQTRIERNDAIKHQEELEFKRMFVRYISHEVRTPLNTAIMGLQVLQESLNLTRDKESLETVKDIHHSCDVAVNVLNELLTFDKLEGGTLLLEKTEVKAVVLVMDTINPMQLQAKHAGVNLSMKLIASDPDLLRSIALSVDTNKIAQVIRNLVSNGLKFTPKGGSVTVAVDAISEEDDDGVDRWMLKIDVIDTGAGISAENQRRLFKEIVQFNPGKLQKGGGSGLGLYISHGLTTLHGGRLSVYSKGEGYGCTFTLVLPSATLNKRVSSKSPRSNQSSQKSNKHLVPIRIFIANTNKNDINNNCSNNTNNTNNNTSNNNFKGRNSSMSSVSEIPKSRPQSRSFGLSRVSRGHSEVQRSVHSIQSVSSIHRFSSYDKSSGHTQPHTTSSYYFKKETGGGGVGAGGGGMVTGGGVGNRASANDHKADENFEENNNVESGRDLTILVADDTAISRKMQIRLLKKRCKNCLEAEDGQEAVNRVQESLSGLPNTMKIDLVIMDSVMPILSGLEATKRIRGLGYKGIILGVTGNVAPEDIDSFINHGADAVLPKPFNVDAFDTAVKELLNPWSSKKLYPIRSGLVSDCVEDL